MSISVVSPGGGARSLCYLVPLVKIIMDQLLLTSNDKSIINKQVTVIVILKRYPTQN